MSDEGKTKGFPADIFDRGMDFRTFLKRFTRNREYFLKRYNAGLLDFFRKRRGEADKLIVKLKKGPRRKLLIVAVDWCPDSYNTLGFFVKLAEHLDWETRIFEKETEPVIIGHFKKDGVKESVPVYAFYTENFEPLFWISDRHEEGTRWKTRWLAGRDYGTLSKEERIQFLKDLNDFYDEALFEITAMDVLERLASSL